MDRGSSRESVSTLIHQARTEEFRKGNPRSRTAVAAPDPPRNSSTPVEDPRIEDAMAAPSFRPVGGNLTASLDVRRRSFGNPFHGRQARSVGATRRRCLEIRSIAALHNRKSSRVQRSTRDGTTILLRRSRTRWNVGRWTGLPLRYCCASQQHRGCDAAMTVLRVQVA